MGARLHLSIHDGIQSILSTHKLSNFKYKPCNIHRQAFHDILHYIKSSLGQGLIFPSNSKMKFQAFSMPIGLLVVTHAAQ